MLQKLKRNKAFGTSKNNQVVTKFYLGMFAGSWTSAKYFTAIAI